MLVVVIIAEKTPWKTIFIWEPTFASQGPITILLGCGIVTIKEEK